MNRILLADDSPQALRLAEQILANGNNQVVSVTDGATALHRLIEFDPDLLLCDVYLPTRNGFELARFIKAQPRLKRTRIVFAAGPADRFDEQDASNAGANAILRKPLEATSLLATVEPLLEAAYAERETSPQDTKAGDAPQFDRDTVRAAVTLAIESAMPTLITELTDRVLLALSQQRVALAAPTPVDPPQRPAAPANSSSVPSIFGTIPSGKSA
jgi:CheY-like chemotaxis protein